MAEVIWTEPALSDLDAIAHCIALDNLSGKTARLACLPARRTPIASSEERPRATSPHADSITLGPASPRSEPNLTFGTPAGGFSWRIEPALLLRLPESKGHPPAAPNLAPEPAALAPWHRSMRLYRSGAPSPAHRPWAYGPGNWMISRRRSSTNRWKPRPTRSVDIFFAEGPSESSFARVLGDDFSKFGFAAFAQQCAPTNLLRCTRLSSGPGRSRTRRWEAVYGTLQRHRWRFGRLCIRDRGGLHSSAI